MKKILAFVLLTLGCGAAPEPTSEGHSSPGSFNQGGAGYYSESFDNSDPCSQPYRWVTVWVDGVPTAQLQPVLCVQGFNPDTGDPLVDRGDPNPWDRNSLKEKFDLNTKEILVKTAK